jgi:hypothetical protein
MTLGKRDPYPEGTVACRSCGAEYRKFSFVGVGGRCPTCASPLVDPRQKGSAPLRAAHAESPRREDRGRETADGNLTPVRT